MRYATVEDVIASFPHPILPTIQGEPDYHTIHNVRKLLQANARSIDTHLAGGALGHLGIIVSANAYALVAATTPWANPANPGRTPTVVTGTAAELAASRLIWEQDTATFKTWVTVEQALRKQIITAFEPMYLEILCDDMVGFANTTARDMIDYLFLTYGSITAVDLERNFENMRKPWDPQQPVETLFKQIQDAADYSESGGIPLGEAQQISTAYSKIFATGILMSACRRWNEKADADKTWVNFKAHFAAAYRQHKQMQVESAGTSGYANAAVAQTEDAMVEATIGALANLATATASDRGIVSTLTEANASLIKQLADSAKALKEVKEILKKERAERGHVGRPRAVYTPHPTNYCWSHGYKLSAAHTSASCSYPKPGHKRDATKDNNMGGSQAKKDE
jgi:hypothetical protein